MSARGAVVPEFVALLAVVFALTPPGLARASGDPVLARLRRIARGDWIATADPAGHVPYAAAIRATAYRHGLSPAFLAALVRAESGFNPRAVSSAGAQGLGQLMPATARSLGVVHPFDPRENLDGSARYLAAQLSRFGSVRLALAAYHAGPERASAGLHATPASTRRYVRRVMRFERDYRSRGLP